MFDPWSGKMPWRRKRPPTPVFLPGKPQGQRSLVGYSPRGHKESDTAEHAGTDRKAVSCLPNRTMWTMKGNQRPKLATASEATWWCLRKTPLPTANTEMDSKAACLRTHRVFHPQFQNKTDHCKEITDCLVQECGHLHQPEMGDSPPNSHGFRKGRGTRDQIANIHWIIEKAREFQKNISLLLHWLC